MSDEAAKKFVTQRQTYTVADKMDYIARLPLLKKSKKFFCPKFWVQAYFWSKRFEMSVFVEVGQVKKAWLASWTQAD